MLPRKNLQQKQSVYSKIIFLLMFSSQNRSMGQQTFRQCPVKNAERKWARAIITQPNCIAVSRRLVIVAHGNLTASVPCRVDCTAPTQALRHPGLLVLKCTQPLKDGCSFVYHTYSFDHCFHFGNAELVSCSTGHSDDIKHKSLSLFFTTVASEQSLIPNCEKHQAVGRTRKETDR